MSTPANYSLKASSLGGEKHVPMTLDWYPRHELAAGATISGTPTVTVLRNDAASTDLAIDAASIAVVNGNIPSGGGAGTVPSTAVAWLLTATNPPVIGNSYKLWNTVTLNTGEVLVDSVNILIVSG